MNKNRPRDDGHAYIKIMAGINFILPPANIGEDGGKPDMDTEYFLIKDTKASLKYERMRIEKGYANRTLHIDLTAPKIEIRPVTAKMKEVFTGGKGFCLKLLWDAVKGIDEPGGPTKWNDPENALCIASGPLGGAIYPGAGKSIVAAVSPLTGSVVDSNVGGHFGPYLKFSGFDAIAVTGKAPEDVIVFIDGIEGKIEVLAVSGLPAESQLISGLLTRHFYFSRGNPHDISVVSAGSGARHTLMGCVNVSWYDRRRGIVRNKQAGRGGLGTVMAAKNIKAIVARWHDVGADTNNPADAEALKDVSGKHMGEIRRLDPNQNRMAVVGTTHLTSIMNDFDLLPVKNFQYGKHPEAKRLDAAVFEKMFDKGRDGCWIGCPVACAHGVKNFVPRTGPYRDKEVFVDGPEYETIAGCGSNLGIFDPHFTAEMNFYCDIYGLDTISVGTSVAFVMECRERGLIGNEHDLSFGNKDGALGLVHEMARGEGFGVIVGQGVRRMKKIFAERYGADPAVMNDIGMEAKGLEFSEYITKESLAQQGGYGLALKGPQHDEAWLIFLDMVHNYMPTFEQKAEALHWFPMWRTWFGLCGLCKLPWNDIVPEDNKETPEPAKVMRHVEWYAELFGAITGRKVNPADLIGMSERVYNFQRLFGLRLGFGRREHDDIPYRAMGPVTIEEYASRSERYDKQLEEKYGADISGKSKKEKIALLRSFKEKEYEKLKDAVYRRRGWRRDGVPKVLTVKKLKIAFPGVLTLLKNNHNSKKS